MKNLRDYVNLIEEAEMGGPMPNRPESNPQDVVQVDVPLLIRLLEYAREDAKTDMDLHDLTEKLIAASAEGRVLSMSDYDSLVSKQGQD